MTELLFDYETRSEVDLGEVGLDRYSKHPSTQVILCAYQFDNRKIRQFNPQVDEVPAEFLEGLKDPDVLKVAQNASFEREMTFQKLGVWVPFEQWRDPIVPAHMLSLPGKLEKIGKILRLPAEHCKSEAGEKLIPFFCLPIPIKNKHVPHFPGMEPGFHDWGTNPKEWEEFAAYNRQDVVAEHYFWNRFKDVVPEMEWRGWFLDQEINRAGIPVNVEMAKHALNLALRSKKEFFEQLQRMTGLENPLSDHQMGKWARERGYPYNSMLAVLVNNILDGYDDANSPLTPECREVLRVRQKAKKTSYTKIERLLQVVSDDNLLRYQFRYGAAARTLRWAGGDVQMQNLPRHTKGVEKDFQRAIDLIMAEDYDTIQKEHPSVIGMVVGSLRLMFQVAA